MRGLKVTLFDNSVKRKSLTRRLVFKFFWNT
jgi:hypothetical protein